MTILFVDDDKDTRDLFGVVFSLRGYHCELARNGHDALILLGRTSINFDVTILDYFMPDMNGLEIVDQFRQSEEKRCTCFVLFTRADRGDLEMEAKRLGVLHLVHKPTFPATIIEIIEQVERENANIVSE